MKKKSSSLNSMNKKLTFILSLLFLGANYALAQYASIQSIPQAKDSYWQMELPRQLRNDYIKEAEKYLSTPWKTLPDKVFAEFKTNGNRINYENIYYVPRRQFASLVMAEILEHRGRFMKDIIQGFHYFMEKEVWWGLPAHYPTSFPERSNQVVDLFNAETASMMAWAAYMLHDELESSENGLCRKIRNEIERRMLIPVLTTDYSWKRSTSNWNTWICSNWLSCVLLCETDDTRRHAALNQIQQCLNYFCEAYPSDGGCDEGINYWDRAGGSLIDCVELLSISNENNNSFTDNPKFKAIGSYVYKMYIGKGAYINFADANSYTRPNSSLVYRYGIYSQDTIMTQFARQLANDFDYLKNRARLFSEMDFPSLSRELLFFRHYSTFTKCKPAAPLTRDNWLPDLQVVSARSAEGSINGLYFAAKGGHNDENHNHNDVGNFIVYGNARPLIIDLGKGTYTAQTFSSNRYELINCRSAYHNLPLINGIEQQQGLQYQTHNVSYRQTDKNVYFSLDIASAYPKEANVKTWKRSFSMQRGHNITIEEDYELRRRTGDTEIMLITCVKPTIKQNGTIVLQSDDEQYLLSFSDKQIYPIVEKVNINDNYLSKQWHQNVWRIRLRVKQRKLKNTIQYTLSAR